ncbi:MAG: adenosylcobinamide amidohydrolase [Candidatus Bathyarchaeota archaeon]|nr:adenosylcobinamide amidohydrolase [Candidatus Bathyarchaeota archaeon]
MEQQLAEDAKFIVKENVLAITSQKGLATVSSAIFNGGAKRVKSILNVGVPQGYSDRSLHLDPMELITTSAAKLGITEDYLAMVTAANVQNYSLVSKKSDAFSVYVAATAGCQHGESSGEEMNVQEITGTINLIVLIDGNPTESCMVAAVITATEAKSAALRDLDVRSRYTGDSATGSITDSVTIASTGVGKTISLAGPASKLGKLVGSCTRAAVTQALLKQEPFWGNRTILDRLKERHLPIEKLAAEVSKLEGLAVTAEELTKILKSSPSALVSLLAAAKMDDDYTKNLLPTDFQNWNQITSSIGATEENYSDLQNYEAIDLPPFIKHTLISAIKNSVREP